MAEDPLVSGNQPPPELSTEQLLPIVYAELRQLAASHLARERGDNAPMQPTSLVHATWLRLIGDAAREQQAWASRAHFFGAAALAMRRILVERARQRRQLRRGGGWQRTEGSNGRDLPDLAAAQAGADPVDLLALDTAMQALEAESRDLYQVVMLRWFGGLSVDDTAHALATSVRTVKRRWNLARLWLLERMNGNPDDKPA